MKDQSMRQSAALKARMRRMRAQYRRRTVIVGIILFIIGVAAGIFAQRWYANTKPRDSAQPELAVTASPESTPEPTEAPAVEPEGNAADEAAEDVADEDFGWDLYADTDSDVDAVIFPEDDDTDATDEGADADTGSENVAFPEVEAPAEEAPEVTTEPTPEVTAVPSLSSDQVEEYDPTQAEIPEEYLSLEDENGITEEEAASGEEAPAEEAPAEETPVDETPAEETPAEETPVDETPADETPVDETPADETPVEEAPVEEAAPAGPQVIAIVPYGESFTYSTQIKADGNARVEATDEPYETLSFTQTMQSFLRPTDFANKYSTQYKLQGNEAGAGFELVLNDYTGDATVVPQNVVDISLRSESGNTVERGYQLMDAEIAGNYNVALNTNVPQVLYKRYQYANTGEEMFYLVVTTYNDGVAQQILFQLESDEPEPEPEIVYGTLQRGIKSDEVKALQQRLIDLGYLTGTADGSFGQMTEDAIKAAQEAFGMEPNGIADNAFQQKLFEGVERPAPEQVVYETLNGSSTGEAVVNLQLRLRELGYYDGRADGGYGPMTEAAVKKAQQAYGMEATGVADGAFQQRLYSDEQ